MLGGVPGGVPLQIHPYSSCTGTESSTHTYQVHIIGQILQQKFNNFQISNC